MKFPPVYNFQIPIHKTVLSKACLSFDLRNTSVVVIFYATHILYCSNSTYVLLTLKTCSITQVHLSEYFTFRVFLTNHQGLFISPAACRIRERYIATE